MLEAKSMYFGGEIIAAAECDYQTSRELGLTCPFCNSAVFLRSESVREVKGRIQLVRPYFAHYPSGDANNLDCEKRSRTKQGKEKIEQIKIQARNQRLNLYNAHLWEIFSEDRNISRQDLNEMRRLFGERWCQQQSARVRVEWAKMLDGVYAYIDDVLSAIRGKSSTFQPEGKPFFMPDKDYKEEWKKQSAYMLGCDRRLHRAICFEVADFLATDTGSLAFQKFFKACLFVERFYAPIPQVKKLDARSHVPMIAGLLAGTHWIEQIDKRLNVVQ